jgi:diguanylate cyclase (GGDEF)-like protein/PAS domain S-box-containing protein
MDILGPLSVKGLPHSHVDPGYAVGHRIAEEAVRESERQLRAIIENLPGVAYRCTLQAPWRMSFISDAVEQLTGHPSTAFLSGKVDWVDLVASEDRDHVEATIAEAIARRAHFELRYRVCTPTGLRWVHERGKAAYSQEGLPLFLEGFVGDIHEQALADKNLRAAEERYRLVMRATGDAVWDWDLVSDQLTWNEAITSSYGYAPGDIGPTCAWWGDHVHPDDRDCVLRHIREAIATEGSYFSYQYRFMRADGTYADVFDRGYVIRDETHKAVRMVGAMQDLTRSRSAQAEAARAHNLVQTVIDSVPDHIYVKDASGVFILTNQASKEHWDLVGRRTSDVFPREVASEVEASDLQVLTTGEPQMTELPTMLGAQQRIFQSVKVPWREDGEIKGIIGISRDVTDQISVAEQVQWAANHDLLTGLPNRTFFQSSLSGMMANAGPQRSELSLLVVDLDHFKQVNDTLGHDAGDVLLSEIAAKLKGCIRPGDIVARLGGDEFAIILPNCGAEQANAVGEKIIGCLRTPFTYDGRVLDCRASIGSAVFPTHGGDTQELLKNADMALYAAKGAGRGVARMFDPSIRDHMQKRVSMLALGRKALHEGQMFPYYQPKVNLQTGNVSGFEALLRWRHPRRGICLPGTIAECFEDYDLANEISDRIIDCAIADMRAWLDQGLEFGSIAVNAGASEFRNGKFATSILRRLEHAGVPTSCFQLEVTETVFLGRGAECVENDLKLLSSQGVKIALDDFGTGFASLRHLKQFPVHIIKIDKSFVSDMNKLQDDAAIVRAVINLGQSLGMDVVAEGIETVSQAAELRQMGCGYGQGFLFSKAVPASGLAACLKGEGMFAERFTA